MKLEKKTIFRSFDGATFDKLKQTNQFPNKPSSRTARSALLKKEESFPLFLKNKFSTPVKRSTVSIIRGNHTSHDGLLKVVGNSNTQTSEVKSNLRSFNGTWDGCEEGWTLLENRCFFVGTEEMTWKKAETRCVQLGGHLASITSYSMSLAIDNLTKLGNAIPDPSNTFWIGATDSSYENAFAWTSGAPFMYADWFSGWVDQNGYSSQPSDDGLGNEDCVELRRTFRMATKGIRVTPRLFWNDRNCQVLNKFICEKPRNGDDVSPVELWSCNKTLNIIPGAPASLITSPGFPVSYPSRLNCVIKLQTAPGATLTIFFDAFILEDHPQCAFDRLEIIESEPHKRKIICGDWTGKLKLLRYVSSSAVVILTLRSDPAHTFSGFKIRVTSAKGEGGCGPNWQIRYGSSCLLLANDPQVTWGTASRICNEVKGQLAVLDETITLSWLNAWLHNHPRFTPEARYWIGGELRGGSWVWEDGKPIQRKIFKDINGKYIPRSGIHLCLSVEEHQSAHFPIRYAQPRKHQMKLAAVSHFCNGFGGYICSKTIEKSSSLENRTILGSEGNVTTPSYPANYPNNVHMKVTLEGPPLSRLVLILKKLSLEYQRDCLYDYIGFQDFEEEESEIRLCGHHTPDPTKPVFVSKTNKVILTFHSDWSESASGAVVDWRAVDIRGCPYEERNTSQSLLKSPNYPYFNLPNLECTTIIRVPEGHKIWLQFDAFEVTYDEKEEQNEFSLPPNMASLWRQQNNFIPERTNYSGKHISFNSFSSSNNVVMRPNHDSSSPPSGFLFPARSTSTTLTRRENVLSPQAHQTHDFLFPQSSSSSAFAQNRFTRAGNVEKLVSSSFPSMQLAWKYSSTPSKASAYSSAFLPFDNHNCKLDFLEVHVSDDEKVTLCGVMPEEEVQNLSFISRGNLLKISFRTSKETRGKGFKAHYKSGVSFNEEAVIRTRIPLPETNKEPLSVSTFPRNHEIFPLNFPHISSPGITFTRNLFAPLGNRITINLHNVAKLAPQGATCPQSYLEIEDWYAGKTGTVWRICSFDSKSTKKISITSTFNSMFIREVYISLYRNKQVIRNNESLMIKFNETNDSFTLQETSDGEVIVLVPNILEDSINNIDTNSTTIATITTSNVVTEVLANPSSLDSPVKDTLLTHEETVNVSSDIRRAMNSTNDFDLDYTGTFSSESKISSDTFPASLFESEFPEESNEEDKNESFLRLAPHEKQESAMNFRISYNVIPDSEWVNRTLAINDENEDQKRSGVASCKPSPCIHGGRCVTHGKEHTCLCAPAYTGRFCQVRWCDSDPCVMGRCQLSDSGEGFTCSCETGWGGNLCHERISPCAKTPCQGRGECTVVNNTFSCRCHAWWEGSRCQNRITTIPYKPLSERMFKEPFWLGLITVALVMGCIGIVFCIKKHFADKIEKFFAEEIERSKYGGVSGSRHNPLPSPTGLSPRPRPKSLLVRLNSFRKSSLLSLSSTASSPQGDGSSSFTFDDLLRPHKRGSGSGACGSSPRRNLSKSRSQTVSPRIDSKKILRHLVAPPVSHRAPSFDEFLNLRTQSSKCSVISDEYRRLRSASPEIRSHYNHSSTTSTTTTNTTTTTTTSNSSTSTSLEVERALSADMTDFCLTSGCTPDRRASEDSHDFVEETSLISLVPSPTKQDKKVTFAKLLEKMQKELSSSSSDISTVEDKGPSRATSNSSIPSGSIRRSPRRSPRLKHLSRSSGSGSEEFMETPDISSTEMTPDPPKRLLNIKCASSPNSKTSSPQNRSKLHKISSADSLLAMLRSIGGTSRLSISSPTSPHASEMEDSSAQGSPSTTPTTPPKAVTNVPNDTLLVPGALQVQVHGQPGTSSSSDSSLNLEVPAEKFRCLSPITELPTPMPTPMPSPLPTPSRYHLKKFHPSSESSPQDLTADDTESEYSINISVGRSSSESSGSEPRAFFSCSKSSANSQGAKKTRDNKICPGKKEENIPTISLPISRPTSPCTSPVSSPKTKSKPPPLSIPYSNLLNFNDNCKNNKTHLLPIIRVNDEEGGGLASFDSTPRLRSQSIDVGMVMNTPLITICCVDDSPPSTSSSSTKSDLSSTSFVVPTLSVTVSSPPALRKNFNVISTKQESISNSDLTSCKQKDMGIRSNDLNTFKTSQNKISKTPIITVTTLSEIDSDLDTPLEKCAPAANTTRFLSPLFAANVQATSDGNLSSSGYSSAYSSGPSRCSSNNRLSAGESEEPLTPSVSSIPSKQAVLCRISNAPPWNKRTVPVHSCAEETAAQPIIFDITESETTNDPCTTSQLDPDSALELETNDESHNTEHSEDSESQENTCIDLNAEVTAQRQRLLMSSSHSFPKESAGLTRSTPSIVVLHSSLDEGKRLGESYWKASPTSSRSESPISDSRLSVKKTYPDFLSGKCKLDLLFSDSDGVYDCASSEILYSDSSKQIPYRRHGRKKTKGSKLKNLVSSSRNHGTGSIGEGCKRVLSLDLPTWDSKRSKKLSHKRRTRIQTSVDLISSSSESFTSHSVASECLSPIEILSDIGYHENKEMRDGPSPIGRRRPLVRRESISCRNLRRQKSIEGSEEDEEPNLNDKSSFRDSKLLQDLPRYKKKARFRGFGNQLRFLHRPQQSQYHRDDQLMTRSESSESDSDSSFPSGERENFSPEPSDIQERGSTSSQVDKLLPAKDKKYKLGERNVLSS